MVLHNRTGQFRFHFPLKIHATMPQIPSLHRTRALKQSGMGIFNFQTKIRTKFKLKMELTLILSVEKA